MLNAKTGRVVVVLFACSLTLLAKPADASKPQSKLAAQCLVAQAVIHNGITGLAPFNRAAAVKRLRSTHSNQSQENFESMLREFPESFTNCTESASQRQMETKDLNAVPIKYHEDRKQNTLETIATLQLTNPKKARRMQGRLDVTADDKARFHFFYCQIKYLHSCNFNLIHF